MVSIFWRGVNGFYPRLTHIFSHIVIPTANHKSKIPLQGEFFSYISGRNFFISQGIYSASQVEILQVITLLLERAIELVVVNVAQFDQDPAYRFGVAAIFQFPVHLQGHI